MGKATKRKPSKRKESLVERFVRPTEAREAHNDFRSAGPAVRVIPPIETLYSAGKLTSPQFNALARYADIANAAERSEIKSNIDFTIYGTGEGLPHFGVRMNIELGRLQRAAATNDDGVRQKDIADTVHAICVREISLSAWAMERAGSVMRERQAEGRKIVRWYEPRRMALRIATAELQEGADRLARELGMA